MIFNKNLLFPISLFSLFLIAGCNQSSDQREFEREAYSLPEGITETQDGENIINNDPDDWRIAPFFQGLVIIEPAYPNPVQTTDQVFLNLLVTGIESLSGLDAFVYYGSNNLKYLGGESRRPISSGSVVLPLSPLDIAQFRENPQGTYRVVLVDANENVISYGDIRVE